MTVKRTFSWLLGLPVAIVLVCFAVANRHWVAVSFDPFTTQDPWLAVSMPVFALFFAGIFCGLVVGGVVVWLRQGKWRKVARKAMTSPPSPPGSSDRELVQLQ